MVCDGNEEKLGSDMVHFETTAMRCFTAIRVSNGEGE